MSLRPVLCLVLICTWLTACQSHPGVTENAPAPDAPAQVLLISIDSLRPVALGQGNTPNLDALVVNGVHATGMTPSYPSLTFPNHYTLVTGLRPDHHGVVHNLMQDPQLGKFKNSDMNAAADGRWWNQAQPVWVTAEKAQLPTAIWAWPGNTAQISGVRPTRYRRYDPDVTAWDRASEVADWLSTGPHAQRARFAALYFEKVDQASHTDGPDSTQAGTALREVDAAIGHLLEVLRSRGLEHKVNVIVVSDHGMAPVQPGHVIALNEMVDEADAQWISPGQVVGFMPRPGREEQAEARLLGRHDHYACWKKSKLPAQWHYGHNPRIPDIVCQLDEGWDALPPEIIARRGSGELHGSHGYAPELPTMRATFVAAGPAFRHGVTLPVFDNVNVYPLLMHLLDLPPRPNDGSLEPLRPALVASEP